MRADRIAALAGLALVAAGCGKLDAPAPAPRSVVPGHAYVANRTPVVIHGDGFVARTVQSPSGAEPTLDTTHRAWLGTTPLEDVTWVDAHTLQATVPAGLTPGKLTLAVENAYGRRGRLDDAFEVVAIEGAGLVVTVEPGATIASVGQEIPLVVRVSNVGSATAQGVDPVLVVSASSSATADLLGPAPGAAAELLAGDAVEFAWTCVATGPGALTLSASASAVDTFSGDRVESASASADVAIQVPAGFVAVIAADRATATVGQRVALSMRVSNGGSARAVVTGVAPSFTPGEATTCTAPAPAPPFDVASASSVTVAWSCTTTAPGTVALNATVRGTDANSGAPLSATPAVPAAVVVQAPPSLTAAVTLPPGTTGASVAQPLALTLTVTNAGGAPAILGSISPTVPTGEAACTAVGPAPPRTVAGGTSATFTWTCTPAAPGQVSFGASVGGSDANTGQALAVVTATSTPAIDVVLPASIVAVIATSPASGTTLSTGQAVSVTFTVSNGGSATARITSVTTSATGGAAACTPASPAASVASPKSIAAGQSLQFTWTCTPSGAGTLTLSGTAAGTDANSGAAISATIAADQQPAFPVQAAATIAAALTPVPASGTTVSTGQAVAVTFRVANGGTTAARITSVTTSATGAAATCTTPAPAASVAAPVSIAGGATQDFTWTCTPSAAGTLTLSGTASGKDALSGAALSATIPPGQRPSFPVLEPAGIAATVRSTTPASGTTVSTGQAVAITMRVTNSGGTVARITSVTTSATGAAATCTTPAPAASVAAPVSVAAGGGTQDFTWTCTPSAAGTLTLSGTASGTDATFGGSISASIASADQPSYPVQTAAQPAALLLDATVGADLNPVPVGTDLGMRLTLVNQPGSGGAAANVAVTPTPPPGGTCTPSTFPSQQVVAGGNATFNWTCTSPGPYSGTLGVSLVASDASSGAPLSPTITGASVSWQ